MNKLEHIRKHEELHQMLSELVCDILLCTPMLPNENTILDLMKWSLKQTTNPDEPIYLTEE